MEEFGPFWTYQECIDEVRQKLLYTTMELETLKMEASEQMRRHREDVKKLIELLNAANKERDEARDHLHKIVNKLMPCNNSPIKANSSITESSSLSDTYNHNSYNSSPPVDSFFDAVTSPDSSRIDFMTKTFDPADAAIESIVKGKVLPEKGKLLEAVTAAGPLLQTLLVAGPLPRWRNPPPPLQTFKIPAVSIKGCETVNSMSCSASLLNFTVAPAVKRQRLH